jgi:hypothetical protein
MSCVVALCRGSVVDKKLGDGERGIYFTPIIEGFNQYCFFYVMMSLKGYFSFLNHLIVAEMILFNCLEIKERNCSGEERHCGLSNELMQKSYQNKIINLSSILELDFTPFIVNFNKNLYKHIFFLGSFWNFKK